MSLLRRPQPRVGRVATPARTIPDVRGETVVKVVAVGVVAVAGAAVLLLAGSALVFGGAPGWSSVEELCAQPDSVSYDDDSTYAVFLREPSVSLSLANEPSEAVVARSGSDGSYGVFVELNPSNEVAGMSCEWTAEGVAIAESNGIVHLVPPSVFTGGR